MYNLLPSRFRSAGLFSVLAMGALAVTMPAAAQTITVGTADPNNPNNIPFGTGGQYSSAGAAEYQQLYSGSAFSGPVSINTISFSSGGFAGNTVEAVNYNISVYLSNTTKTNSTLTSTFSQNYGTNRKLVYNGLLSASLTANNAFDLSIPIVPNTFVFNGAAASGSNLLFDVFINSDSGSNNFEFFQGTSSTLTSSAFFANYPGNNPVTSDGGLLTRFTVTPSAAPEPSSVVVLVLGASAVATLAARRRRASAL